MENRIDIQPWWLTDEIYKESLEAIDLNYSTTFKRKMLKMKSIWFSLAGLLNFQKSDQFDRSVKPCLNTEILEKKSNRKREVEKIPKQWESMMKICVQYMMSHVIYSQVLFEELKMVWWSL